MKLRFRNNSVRLRVNRREVGVLAAGGPLAEQVQFPGDTSISYILEGSAQPAPQATFQDGVIRITAPLTQVSDWANCDSVGMYFELPVNGTALRIAIEKDLECVDGPEEERDPEAFPRVALGKKC